MISLIDPAFIKRLSSLIRETDKRIQEIEIIKSEVGLKELVGLKDLLYKSDDLRIVDVNPLIIENTIVRTRFYIIKSLRIKIVFEFPFIRKARVIFRYLKDEEDGPVFILLYDFKTKVIISVKTNTETKKT